jgi:hypothetical protein
MADPEVAELMAGLEPVPAALAQLLLLVKDIMVEAKLEDLMPEVAVVVLVRPEVMPEVL